MDRVSDWLEAVQQLDLEKMKLCLEADPACINGMDSENNNAMHICVLGGASIIAPHIMKFLVESTSIDLHHPNSSGINPLDAAYLMNDQAACDLLEPLWHKQLDAKFPTDPKPSIRVVSVKRTDMDEPGPT